MQATDLENYQSKKKTEEIEKIKALDKIPEKPLWRKYYKKANLIRKEGFIDHKPPNFLKKGEYLEPIELFINMYRDDSHYNEIFKLYHKPLSVGEKFKVLGES